MKEDQQLLREFLSVRSEQAFAELVQRHVDLVYSAALRQLGGDAHLARDASQAVFCELARKASALASHRNLSGWLYNTARFISSRIRRSESRRTSRELAFAMNIPQSSPASPQWNDLEPLLDDAMQELSERDREAIVLRYFRNESLARVGAAIGATDNAARMRVERALEKLRDALGRRGVHAPSAVLASLLTANAISSAPVGLAAIVASPALAAAALSPTFSLFNLMTTAQLKTTLACLALTGTGAGLLLAHRENAQLESELAAVRQQAAASKSLAAHSEQVLADPDELARLRTQHSELMRLRAEVTQLREKQRATQVHSPSSTAEGLRISEAQRAIAMKEATQTIGLARMHVAKGLGMALHKFAAENDGKLPVDLRESADYFPPIPDELSWIAGLSGDGDFEIVFQGTLDQVENPARAIIVREKEAYHTNEDGSAQRTYLFADGHVELHTARDGNFEPWEQERLPRLKSNPPLPSFGE